MFNTNPFETDLIQTDSGDLEIAFLGHGTLMMMFAGKVIHIDPYSKVADYSQLPKADLILITHEHGDHLDPGALAHVRSNDTEIVINQGCAPQVEDGIVLQNGDMHTYDDIKIEAVPAYNILHKRPDGHQFHPRGAGNGYVLTMGGTRVYIAGDTENIPELRDLVKIDVAFLPMYLPYTMTPEMAAEAAKAFHPKMLYPYHFGSTDTGQLVAVLEDEKDIEIRIRKMA